MEYKNDGIRTATGWINKDDGLLVYDRNGDGVVNNGGELFGDNTLLKGVQFHPEFAQEGMRAGIAQNRAHIADADALIAAVPAVQPHATALLQRFAQLALNA